MATMQATRPKVATEITQLQSLAMVQNLLRGAVSQISFLRNLFEESNYRDVKMHTMTVRGGSRAPSPACENWRCALDEARGARAGRQRWERVKMHEGGGPVTRAAS